MAIRGALKGLAKIKEQADTKRGFSGDGESTFLKLSDGESAKIRFLQEFEEDAPNYDPRRGQVIVVNEHANPKDYRRCAVCTMEEENRCWGCEQTALAEIGKKWKARMRFYANVLVRGTEGAEDKVKILAQGFSDKNVGHDLTELASEYGSLGGQDCKLSRKGSGQNDTSYSLIPLPPKVMTKEDKAREVLDLGLFIKYVEYDKQAAYYNGTGDESNGGTKASW